MSASIICLDEFFTVDFKINFVKTDVMIGMANSSFKEKFDNLTGEKHVKKLSNYFDIYDEYLSKFFSKEKIYLLEIGLLDGGSIELWREYFGDKLVFYGIDVNPVCKSYEKENVNIFIGSQSDEKFLTNFTNQAPSFDIIIDDGGHTMKQQLVSFHTLFKHVNLGGVYICEDTHTSYWYPYGGGLGRKSSFIEFSKSLVDKLHYWHYGKNSSQDYYVENLSSVHFYDSIVVFKKNKVTKPYVISRGNYSESNKLYEPRHRSKFFYAFHKNINKVASFFGFKGYDYIFWD